MASGAAVTIPESFSGHGRDGESKIVVDTLMRDRVIFVQISNTWNDAALGDVQDYKVLRADGRPLPGWVEVADNANILVRAPVADGTLDLRIIATLSDGSTIERGVTLHLADGQVEERTATRPTVPMFEEQIRSRNAR